METITVNLDGNDVAVPLDTLKGALPEGAGLYGGPFGDPDGYVNPNSDDFRERLNRHAKSVIQKDGYLKKDDAYSPDALKRHFAAKGIDLNEDGLPIGKLTDEQRNAIANAIREDEVTPIKQQLEEISGKYAAIQSEKLRLDLRTSLTGELKEEVFKPVVPGAPSPFDTVVQSMVKRDDEGKPYLEGEGGLRHYDVAPALLKHIGKHAKDLLADKSQRGLGPGGQHGGGDSKVKTQAEIDAMSPAERSKFFLAGGKSSG